MAQTGAFRRCARKVWPGLRRLSSWFDPLRDEGKAYADALAAAGVETKYHPGAGLIHGYFGLGDASATAKAEAQRTRADFKAMLERGV